MNQKKGEEKEIQYMSQNTWFSRELCRTADELAAPDFLLPLFQLCHCRLFLT